MKVLTGFAIIKDSVGYKITYSYSIVNNDGLIEASNKKESFVALDDDLKNIINELEGKISLRL